MLNLTRRLVAIRRAKSALRRGSYEPVQAPEGCFAYLRKSGDERVFVALNFGAEELEGPLPVVPRALALLHLPWRERKRGPGQPAPPGARGLTSIAR